MTISNAQAKAILDVLSSSEFEHFYETYLDQFISGYDESPTEQEVLEEIKRLFSKIDLALWK